MKSKIILIAGMLFAALLVTGCAPASATPAVEATAVQPEVVVFRTDVPSGTATPQLTPTIAIPTATPTATPAAPVNTPSAANGTLELTLEQLKLFNGKDGNPAYIAVDGILYDVTSDRHWSNGTHEGYGAGKDLTDAIKNKAPHGTKILNGVPIVGKLIAG
jgi:predicted heme/steroid binding protein